MKVFPFRRLWLAGLATILIASAAVAAGPSISVSVSPTKITNEGEEAVYTLTASPTPSRKIAVDFVMTGTAAFGINYVLLGNFSGGRIVIPAGQSFTTVTLHSFSGGPAFLRESATMNILGGDRYRVGSPNHATVIIVNQP